MQASHPPLVRTRLSIMMFLEFFIWGGWGLALAGYASDTLQFTGPQIGWLVAVTAIGAIVSPLFVGLIADRFFATERVLCVLHLFGGASLIAAGMVTKFEILMALIMLNGLLFMPTIALVNSLAFRHLPDPDKFPRIAVLGTIGWIVVNLIVSVFLGGTGKPYFLYLSGAAGLLQGLYCLTLPHTPPKGGEGGVDAFGIKALGLLKDASFLIFVACVFLLAIPACSYFFTLCVPLLQQRGYPSPLALGTLNQFSEIVFMFSMPWFVAKLGLKRVIAIGMAAWALRYVCFSVDSFELVLVGLLLHGFCYSFFYVGAYMYIDRCAPADLKASAQSLLAFLLLGVAWFAGGKGAGQMMAWHPAPVRSMAAVVDNADDPRSLPAWGDPNAATSAWRYLNLSATVNELRGGEKQEATPDLAALLDKDDDDKISMAEVKAISDDGLTFGETTYTRDEMVAVFKEVAEKVVEGDVAEDDIVLDRKQWLAAQSCDWRPIWLYPGIACFVILAIFFAAFREKTPHETADES